MGSVRFITVGCALSLPACVDAERAERMAAEPELAKAEAALMGDADALEIDARRSLAVTEQPILERFSFERVMGSLACQANVRGLTATTLFQQWWDTQNPGPGRYAGGHCDAQTDAQLGPVLNGFPYSCRPAPAEGNQVSCDPFKDPACKYIPVGLFNRFDLAPADGSSCGEYRIVFAKASGQTNTRDRNLLIFEASMPNPYPRAGLAGCRPIVGFWAELSRIDDLKERARRLEKFYFEGLGHRIPAVIDIAHFGDNAEGRGQVRTNQFMQDGLEARSWSLREFKLEKQCVSRGRGRHSRSDCTLRFVPQTNKVNPYGPLFAPTPTHAKQDAFQDFFPSQVEALAANELAAISMQVPDTFNSAQSQASGSTETDYLVNYAEGGELEAALQERLDALGSDLEPIDIVARAQTQTCAGCHRLSNGRDLGQGLVWPSSLGFTHVSERETEVVDGVTRFRISDALTSTLLPARQEVMSDFLAGFSRRLRGRSTH